ncbi:hypothetical protein OPV22_001067 [Ensete ventricosum]|uniref:Uncharacterized protein n=1 Tax=Ensete ventricosum TaxID=4639 RepID=A0AAV8RSW7_ENSVE|nr:hypothetical protein OPV22_001067 [Ensete ventricosum]
MAASWASETKIKRAKVADADEPVGVGEGGGDDDELLAVRRKPTNDADLSRGGDDEELVVERRKPTNDTDRSRSPMPMGTLKSVKTLVPLLRIDTYR